MSLTIKRLKEYWVLARTLRSGGVVSRIVLFALLVTIPIRKKLFGRVPIPVTLACGTLKRRFYARDAADIAALTEMFVDREYDIAIEGTCARIIDIGSHIGTSVLFFKSRYPDAVITAYEPDPDNFAMLMMNCESFSNVECINAAISSSSGTVDFYKNSRSSISSSLLSRGDGEEKVSVRAVVLDDVLQDSRPNLVKFDVEGAEYAIFSSAHTLNRATRYIGEMHYDLMPQGRDDFLNLFPGFSPDERIIGPHRSIMMLESQMQ